MKACFFLQRRFAFVGNEIAALLKERHGISEFCAYVSTRDSYNFTRTQKDVVYTSILFDEEIHDAYHNEVIDLDYLKRLEEEYGIPTLWRYIENDRVIRYGQLLREYPHTTPPYTHEDMLRIVQATAKKVDAFLEKEKPDLMVFSVVGGIGPMFLYHMAKKRNIRTLMLLAARVLDRHVVSEHYSMFTDIEASGQPSKNNMEAARLFLKNFRSSPVPYTNIDTLQIKAPDRSRHFKFLSPKKIAASLHWQWRLWIGYFNGAARHDYSTIKPWYIVLDRVKRKVRILIGYEDLYDEPVAGERFAYYPLHMEPEMVTMLYAPIYNDQLWVVKQIAKSLPVGYKLYIKEHLAMFGFRTRAFYQELKKIPNIKLISPKASSFDLIRKAQLIAVLTGTVGWEALLLKKPVITFGEIFYNVLSGAKRCTDVEQLPFLIREQLDSFTHNEEELESFLAKIYEQSVSVDLTDIWERERSANVKQRRNELVPLADLIFSTFSNHC